MKSNNRYIHNTFNIEYITGFSMINTPIRVQRKQLDTETIEVISE